MLKGVGFCVFLLRGAGYVLRGASYGLRVAGLGYGLQRGLKGRICIVKAMLKII
jgi:hypothetical protein